VTLTSIPFHLLASHEARVAAGEVVRYGAILKDVGTGKIIGHVQETGLFDAVASKVIGGGAMAVANPVTAAMGGAGQLAAVAQNSKMIGQLSNLTEMMGSLKTLNIVGTLASVAGVGVTVASTAMILHRIKGIDRALQDVAQRMDRLPDQIRELELEKTLRKTETQLERLQELPLRQKPTQVVENVEKELHESFNTLHEGVHRLILSVEVDEGLLRSLLAGLAICGAAQTKSLIWLNEKEAAQKRAELQAAKLLSLSAEMPMDRLQTSLGNDECAQRVHRELVELRSVSASRPLLCERLINADIDGRHYLEEALERDDAPVLLLPV
jgi:hypothetical protein